MEELNEYDVLLSYNEFLEDSFIFDRFKGDYCTYLEYRIEELNKLFE